MIGKKIYQCGNCCIEVGDRDKFCHACGMRFNDAEFKGKFTVEKPKKVKELEKKLHIKFELYEKTGSLYAEYKNKRIRLSDHPSKFKEKGPYSGKESIDLDYTVLSVQDMINAIKGIDPFVKLRKGDKLKHRRLGTMTFISYDKKKEYVEVKLRTREVKKYWPGMFTF